MSPVGLLYSGGLDSSVLLCELLAAGQRVQPLYVESGLVWEAAEQRAARRFLAAIARPALAPLVVLQVPLADVYGDHWSVTGRGIPDRASADEAVYLPGRNPLLAVKARLWCQLHGVGQLAIGCLASSPFADASSDFFASFAQVLDAGMGDRVRLIRPLADKLHVMRRGGSAPLELTMSCLAPSGTLHCGRCNKCAERQRAFAAAGMIDRTQYQDSAGGDRGDAQLLARHNRRGAGNHLAG